MKQYIIEHLKKHNLQNNIIVKDAVNRDVLYNMLANTDVFILPSRAEGLSISLLEAMSAANAIITTYDPIGKHDAIIHNENGLLFESDNVDVLVKYIILMIDNKDLRMQFGREAKKTFDNKFATSVVIPQIIKHYDFMQKK